MLTEDQIETFLQDGVLVVDGLLTDQELDLARQGLASTLARFGIDVQDLSRTGHALRQLSSTNGSGGVLDIFYEDWKLDIATHRTLLSWTQQLWKAAYSYTNNSNNNTDDNYENDENENDDEDWKRHPFGPFDPSEAFAYIDRIGYRLPTALSEELGQQQGQASDNSSSSSTINNNNNSNNSSSKSKKKKKTLALQRGLTPHLDCCPETFDQMEGKTKWRPIQCMISLTDNLEANMGGFEAAKGFHCQFRKWTRNRPPTTIRSTSLGAGAGSITIPAPCVGEYTHIRPKEDSEVMQQIRHVPIRAGSAVFWDNRIPHANAYRHDGTEPRAVVYCSFLPNVDINRIYVKNQLQSWKHGKNPTDQWIRGPSTNVEAKDDDDNGGDGNHKKNHAMELLDKLSPNLSPLQRRLLGMEAWE